MKSLCNNPIYELPVNNMKTLHYIFSIFLKELEKYEAMPENVGHCFVTWVSHTQCSNGSSGCLKSV